MAKLALKKAATDVTVYLFAQDSSKTTGEGLTGLAYNTGSLVASYVRPGAARAALSLATQTVTGAHSDGGFVEVDATNMPGVYRLDLPDAVCATGVPSALVMLKGATNLAPVLLEIQLTDFDLNTAITAAGIADAVWDEATADHTTATSFGSLDANVDAILADTGTDGVKIASAQTVATVTNLTNLPTMPNDWVTAAGVKADAVTKIQNGLALEATLTAIKGAGWTTETLAAIDVLIDAIKAKTDNIPASPAQAGEYTAAIAAIPTTAPDNASISAILEDTGTTIPGLLSTTGVVLTAAGVDAILDEAVIGSYTMRQLLKVFAAALAGKATGGGTTTVTFRGVDDASNVIVATVDANGNRSAVTLTV